MDQLLSFADGSFGWNLTFVLIGLVGLYFGAEWLVKGSVDISLVLKISPLIIGLTVVAFGTSAPEMFAGVAFNLDGLPDAAIGNVVGSNICNIALMLGIAALIRPVPFNTQLFKRDLPLLFLATGGFIYMLTNDYTISRFEGGILFAGIILYLIISFRVKGEDPKAAAEFEEEIADIADEVKPGAKFLVLALALVFVGLAVLTVGAKLLTVGAPFIAREFGVSEAIIGLTLIALGTSLPEIATAVVASLKKHSDIITGNAIGSCLFNLLAVVGLVALIKPIEGVKDITFVDLGFMAGVLLISVRFLFTRVNLTRFEGILLLGVYGLYCFLLSQR
ncbi:MAG: cation:H+ antiporter [Verrucomicrobiales bacterium]|jgi:cation:H+ antiporter